MRHSGTFPGSRSIQYQYAALAVGLALVCVLAACGSSAPKKAQGTATAKPTPASPTATPLPDGWGLVYSPAVGQEGRLLAVAAVAANDAWAVGQYEGADSLQRTLIEHWGGSQWAYVNSPNPGAEDNVLQGVAADSPSDAWAVGDQINAAGTTLPLIEHWNGTAWSVAIVPSVGQTLGSELTGVAAISPQDAWAVGYFSTSGGQSAPNLQQPLALHWNGSQWQSVAMPSPSTGSYESLSAVAAVSSHDVWAVGDDSAGNSALIEHWDGSAWKVVAAPTAVNGGALTGLAAVASGDVWAVGSGAGTVRQGAVCGIAGGGVIAHWDGTRWSNVALPTLAGATQGVPYSLAAVAATSAHDVWAVGNNSAYISDLSGAYTPVILHYDGTNWTVAQAPSTATAEGLVGVAATASGAVWSVGQYEGRNGPAASLIVQESGGVWSPVPSPSPGTLANQLAGAAAITPNDAWVVGDSADGTLTEHWNGAGWSVIPSVNATTIDNRLSAVTAVASSDVWAVGAAWDAQTRTQALAEHWNGATWTLAPSPTVPGAPFAALRAAAAVSSGDVWAGGVAATPLLEHWNGSAWSVAPSPSAVNGTNLDAFGINGIAAVSATDVWAVGGNTATSCAGTEPALIEHWDGTRWTAMLTSQIGILEGVTAVAADDVWAVGVSYASVPVPTGALILHWNGKQWSEVPNPAPSGQGQSYQLKSVAARAANDVFAAGVAYEYGGSGGGPNSQALVERWNGTSWSVVQVPQPGVADNALAAIAALAGSRGDVWVAGAYDDCPYYVCDAQQSLIEHFAG